MNRVRKTTVVALAVSSAFVMTSTAHATIIAFDWSTSDVNTAATLDASVTKTNWAGTGLGAPGVSNSRLRITGNHDITLDAAHSLNIRLDAEAGKYFDLTSGDIKFDFRRGYGANPLTTKLLVYAASGSDASASSTLVYESGVVTATVSNVSSGAIASVNGTNQYDSLFLLWYLAGTPEGYPDTTVDNSGFEFDNFSVTGEVVPEPASLALMGLGGLLVLGGRRRN